jgi:hypothetical protein
MLFFSHGNGWLPEGMLISPRPLIIDKGDGVSNEMEYTDFAAAIPDNQFDFIIFDACFMADAVVLYELRNKTKYVLASSAEIITPGFTPIYKNNIMQLFNTKNPVENIITGFADAYCKKGNIYNSFTISVTKMNEMEALVSVTKTALQGKDIKEENLSINDIQTFDRPEALIQNGYVKKSRYFDLAHTVQYLASPSNFALFENQMNKTVIWKLSSREFLTNQHGFVIDHHCGISTYIKQEDYPEINTAFEKSAWYKAVVND